MFPVQYILTVGVVILSGCASLPGAVTEQVDGRQVEYVLSKNGPDVVVFESGLGGTLHNWAKVYPEVSKHSTAFAYNRPGYEKSEKAGTPRDGEHVVNELRELLKTKGLNPPYVLVGHSLGGLYMQHFARRYPDEVRALVLVDSTHPAQFKGKGAPEHWPTGAYTALRLLLSDTEEEEFDAINSTGDLILSMPAITDKPVIVLSASKPLKEKSELADDSNEKRKDIARLYPGSRQVWVDSGHVIPLEKPESIIAVLDELLAGSPKAVKTSPAPQPDKHGVRRDITD